MSAGFKETVENYWGLAQRRYDALADNERLLVQAVGVLVVLALVYLILIAPAQQSVTAAQLKLSGQQSLLSWMKENESAARQAAGGGGVKKSDQPIQTIITSTAGPLGVAVKRFENESENKVRVWLEKVSFDKMVRWLGQLESRYGLVIVNVSVEADKEPGLVTAKLVLQN